ncbi:MAG: hypothetical protein WBN34_08595 [Woeseia sp.]
MPNKATSVWLPRVIFESALITLSILLALGLDEWREDRQNEEMIEQAMYNFLIEIRQNKARVDDAAPFNRGLSDVLRRRHAEGGIASTSEFVSIMESYSPAVLQSTAWETALATGSLAKMDYNLVTALSLTYNLQLRYQQTNRSGLELTSPQNLSSEKLDLAVYNSVRHLDDVTRMETELAVVYEEAESVILNAWGDMMGADSDEIRDWAAGNTLQ